MSSSHNAPTLVTAPASTMAILAQARLPTRFGDFRAVAFATDEGGAVDDFALVVGEVDGAAKVPTRLQSECVTGEVFGSLRCDCRDQLELALGRLAESQLGVLLYLRQEGRGIGLANKMRAYALQDEGMDTVEANLHMGFDDDLRSYGLAAAMLRALGVGSIALHTNNPRKVDGLRGAGIEVAERVPLVAGARDQNQSYLAAKRKKSGHLL